MRSNAEGPSDVGPNGEDGAAEASEGSPDEPANGAVSVGTLNKETEQ